MRRILLCFVLMLAAFSAQAVPPRSIALTTDLLSRLPRAEVTAALHDAKPSRWSGVRLRSILTGLFAIPTGEKLRGGRMAAVVRATASDGYQVVFSLAELDEDFGNLDVLVADQQDGMPIDAADGPIRLVVPSDKRGARWVRNLTRLEILELKE